MQKSIIILLVSLYLVTASCSKKITVENLNKPFYNEFEANIRKVYLQYDNTIPFKSIYDSGKREVDRSSKFRNKVIDSLGLINQDKWLLIELNSTNYSGVYEKTFIIFDDKCVFYDLPQYGVSEDFNKIKTSESSIESLKIWDNKNIYEIYQAFQQDKLLKDINSEPNTNPLLDYRIISVKNKKINFYKLSSKDYIIKNW